MRIAHPVALALTATLLGPALAGAGEAPERQRAREWRSAAFERQQDQVLLQIALSGDLLGERSAALLAERARLARRIDQLELVVRDGLALLEAQSQGLVDPEEGHEILLRSPSAVLARQESRPTVLSQSGAGGTKWTRGSWMDSPDGA